MAGKVILITGASSGMSKEVDKRFIDCSVDVFMKGMMQEVS
jgi:NADP-dependent 3-hydroxy acid dehydrogenase YdfG